MSLWISYNGRNHLSRLTIRKSTKKIKNNAVFTTTDEAKALSDVSCDFEQSVSEKKKGKKITCWTQYEEFANVLLVQSCNPFIKKSNRAIVKIDTSLNYS
jgi:hypothetical protein